MDSIPFTQFLRPNGQQVPITIDMEDQVLHDKAETLIEAGWQFEAEVLMSGIVSVTCERDAEGGEAYIQLAQNGLAVVTAVRSLVEDAYAGASF